MFVPNYSGALGNCLCSKNVTTAQRLTVTKVGDPIIVLSGPNSCQSDKQLELSSRDDGYIAATFKVQTRANTNTVCTHTVTHSYLVMFQPRPGPGVKDLR
jgi:hypothetical protein